MAPIRVDVLDLGTVQLPRWHPRAADRTASIRGFLVRHPDGAIVVDTGVGTGNEFIDDQYAPSAIPLVRALHAHGVDERDVAAIVNTHLHFDHCGQNHALPSVPIHVQTAELTAAEAEFYTVPEWAHIDASRRRTADGDEQIADGVRLLATPGHTPGHQSVLVGAGGPEQVLVVGQCCYTCTEFGAGDVATDNVHDESWLETGRASLDRLRALRVDRAVFSHDHRDWIGP